ncbi:peptide hydrolase [Trypanosoma cruzi]|nr:peptide hydrolase [Trypanosoma cruzi]
MVCGALCPHVTSGSANGEERPDKGFLCLSFLSADCRFFFEHIGMVFYGVVMGCVVSLVLFGPNWYQHEDPDQRWCDEAEVKEYYRVRQMLLDELEEEESNEELQALTKNRAEGAVEEKM